MPKHATEEYAARRRWGDPYDWATTARPYVRLYVRTTGSDSGDGSVGSPYMTLQRAFNDIPLHLGSASIVIDATGLTASTSSSLLPSIVGPGAWSKDLTVGTQVSWRDDVTVFAWQSASLSSIGTNATIVSIIGNNVRSASFGTGTFSPSPLTGMAGKWLVQAPSGSLSGIQDTAGRWGLIAANEAEGELVVLTDFINGGIYNWYIVDSTTDVGIIKGQPGYSVCFVGVQVNPKFFPRAYNSFFMCKIPDGPSIGAAGAIGIAPELDFIEGHNIHGTVQVYNCSGTYETRGGRAYELGSLGTTKIHGGGHVLVRGHAGTIEVGLASTWGVFGGGGTADIDQSFRLEVQGKMGSAIFLNDTPLKSVQAYAGSRIFLLTCTGSYLSGTDSSSFTARYGGSIMFDSASHNIGSFPSASIRVGDYIPLISSWEKFWATGSQNLPFSLTSHAGDGSRIGITVGDFDINPVSSSYGSSLSSSLILLDQSGSSWRITVNTSGALSSSKLL